jgi:RNA polymerase sigma factor (sigma-70 family)
MSSVAQQRDVETAETFARLFVEQRARLRRALFRIVGDTHEAEELTQDTFLAVWERWDRVASMDDPTGYLYRSALNRSRSRFRRLQMAAERTPTTLGEPEDLFAVADLRDQVERSLRELPERQRAAVLLVDLLDLPSGEAAEILGITPASVRSLASKARANLKSSMVTTIDESS